MPYGHAWKWNRAIADGDRFAAWSRDLAHLQAYMVTPGKLLPREVPALGRILKSGEIELVSEWTPNEFLKGRVGRTIIHDPTPQPFSPLLLCGPDGTGEPIFTATEVTFNDDVDSGKSLKPFRITFEHLQAPHHGRCMAGGHAHHLFARCALVRMAHYFPDIRFYSDGGKLAFHIPGEICRYVFGDSNTEPLWMYDEEDEE